jgi:peptidoglycan L-alanyl-D-glutamate endopeptidase CwlK
MFKFGNRSNENLEEVHQDLQLIMEESIKVSDVDFGITEGYRAPAKQFEYYKRGREYDYDSDKWVISNRSKVVTYLDGTIKKSKHNENPAMAVDIYIYIPGKPRMAYDFSHMSYVAGVITATTKRLLDEGEIKHSIRWGGNWDGDGELITDQSFDDLPHFELVKQ